MYEKATEALDKKYDRIHTVMEVADYYPHSQNKWWGAGVVICLERGADLHMMRLQLNVSCFSKIQIGFTFPAPAYPGTIPRQSAVKRMRVIYSCM